MVTRNRVANALAVVAAVVGLVLVFSGAGQKDADDTPDMPPTSQVAPAPPGQVQPPTPAPGRPPTAGQGQAPAPAPTTKDNDGDG